MKNVIFIIVDGMRKDRMGCYGYDKKTTPNIDNFSDNGLKFTKCYAPQNNTLSAFATILTGLNPLSHGLLSHEDKNYQVKDKTIMEVAKKIGYQTIFISPIPSKHKWSKRGVDIAINPRVSDGLVKSKRIIDIFNKMDKQKPFFAILHFYNCRHPFYHKYVEKFFNRELDTGVSMQSQEYDNGLRQFDNDIKPLLDKYKKDKIVIMSDHGIHLGERGLVDQHYALDKHIINVPLIVNFLGKHVTDALFSQEDIGHLILNEEVRTRRYILAYEKTKRETVAIIDKNEIKKFEMMI